MRGAWSAFLDEYKQNESAIKATLHSVESETHTAKKEIATLIDLKGNVVGKIQGGDAIIETPDDMSNLVVTHNHPRGHCFSDEDIRTFATAKPVELRVSTPQNTYYSIMQTKALNSEGQLAKDFAAATTRAKMSERVEQWIKDGKVNREDLTLATYTAATDELAREFLKNHAGDFGYLFTEGII